MKYNMDYSVYLVTDRDLMTSKSLEDAVESACKGGCTMVQLREKKVSSREFYEQAERVKSVTNRYHIPLIINDRVDVAMAVGADGVHLGQSDFSAEIARALIGPDKILCVSAAVVTEAEEAQKAGADYIGVGAMFATGTKTDARLISMEELKKIRNSISIPIVVIGGIDHTTAPLFQGIGINGFAVVSAIMGASDVEQAAKEMKKIAAVVCRGK